MSLTSFNNQNNALNIVTRSGASLEITSLLEKTIFGTKVKVRYRQKHIANGIASKLNLEFIQI